MSDFPAIPEPGNTNESIAQTVRALKQAVEILTAQVGSTGGEAGHVFVQDVPPTKFLIGAIWIDTANKGRAFAWNGHQWVTISALVSPDVAADPTFPVLSRDLLLSGSTGNQATLDLAMSADYDLFELEVENITPVNAAASLMARYSVDGGATYIAAGYAYSWLYGTTASATPVTANATSFGNSTAVLITSSQHSTSLIPPLVRITLLKKFGASNTYSTFSGHVQYATVSDWITAQFMGGVATSPAPTHARLLFNSGNIAGTLAYRLYGVPRI